MQENRDFKYVVQDISHIYLGAKMTFEETITWEDVPFKWQAIVNKYFMKEENREECLSMAMFDIPEGDFAFTVLKQLKLKIKIGEYIDKRGKQVYKSNVYSVEEYLGKFSKEMLWTSVFPEEIVISKLALMMIPT